MGGRVVLLPKPGALAEPQAIGLETISSEIFDIIGKFLPVHEYHGISVLSSRLRVRVGIDECDYFAKNFFQGRGISRRLKLHPFEEYVDYSHSLYTSRRLWENIYNCSNRASLGLRKGAVMQNVREIESQIFGQKLPIQFLASVFVHDGQEINFSGNSLFSIRHWPLACTNRMYTLPSKQTKYRSSVFLDNCFINLGVVIRLCQPSKVSC